ATLTFHLRPMNCTLYLFMLLMLYLNLLLVDNSVADEANYTDLESIGLYNYGLYKFRNQTNGKSLLIKDVGFTFKFHQKTFKSLIAFRTEATVFMADEFENGKPVRSFRIVNGSSSQSNSNVDTYSDRILVYSYYIMYCKSHPATYVHLGMFIYKNGTIQYLIYEANSTTENCSMTIEITDGIFNGSTNGNGIIDQRVLIHKKVYPSSSIVKGNVLTFVPKLRCRSKLDQLSCTAESQLNASCSWCLDCKICVQNTSLCNCSKKVGTTVSKVDGLDDSGSSTDSETLKATSQRHDIASEMSTVVHAVTESTKNTNDNDDSTIDSESSKATSQRHDIASEMSTVVHAVTESTKNTNDNNDSTIDSESSKATSQRHDTASEMSTVVHAVTESTKNTNDNNDSTIDSESSKATSQRHDTASEMSTVVHAVTESTKNTNDNNDSTIDSESSKATSQRHDTASEMSTVVHAVTESTKNTNDNNDSTIDSESSKATSQRHDTASEMSTVVHAVTESTKNTNDNNDSTIDSESSMATIQPKDVEQTRSTNDSKPRVAYTKHIYYILGIVSALFVLFIVCIILCKYLYKQY
ncbi:hypothetical protein MN116_000161, partial [Schistosoma mekongi]